MSFQVERGRSESKAKTFKENRSGRTPLNADPRVGNLATKASSAAARSSDAEGGGIRSRTPRCRDHEPQEISHTQQAEKSSAEGAPYPDGATLLASPRSSVDRAAGLATGRPCLGRCWRVHGLFGVGGAQLGTWWRALARPWRDEVEGAVSPRRRALRRRWQRCPFGSLCDRCGDDGCAVVGDEVCDRDEVTCGGVVARVGG